MKSTYLIIGFIAIIVIGAVFFGFSVVGSPFETRARKFDDERVQDIRSLQTSILSYYTKNNSLPENLSEIDVSSYSGSRNIKRDPETEKEYEYSTIDQTKYKICATFTTVSDDKKDPYRYYDEKFEHPKGHHCFDLEIPSYSIKNKPTSRTSTQKTTTFQDEKIKSVITDASNNQQTGTTNFPFGFFSNDSDEWGIRNNSSGPVSVTIKFKDPVKIKSVTSIFTNCYEASCYSWSVKGTSSNNTSITLLPEVTINKKTTPSENELLDKHTIDSNEKFSEIHITAKRNKGVNKYVYWKKIILEYK